MVIKPRPNAHVSKHFIISTCMQCFNIMLKQPLVFSFFVKLPNTHYFVSVSNTFAYWKVFFTHWSVFAALQSPTVVYLRVCSSCSGRGRRRRPRRPRIVRWRRLLSLSQNVPLHTPPPPPWSSRPYLSEKKVLFHRGVQYLKYEMKILKRIQRWYSTVRRCEKNILPH